MCKAELFRMVFSSAYGFILALWRCEDSGEICMKANKNLGSVLWALFAVITLVTFKPESSVH